MAPEERHLQLTVFHLHAHTHEMHTHHIAEHTHTSMCHSPVTHTKEEQCWVSTALLRKATPASPNICVGV